jgi:hypothetical protein
MNERIKQIAEQAGCKVTDDGEWYIPSATGLEKIVYTKGIGLEKFAELIVKECADIALKSGNIANKNISAKIESERIYHKIKEHFGVEE